MKKIINSVNGILIWTIESIDNTMFDNGVLNAFYCMKCNVAHFGYKIEENMILDEKYANCYISTFATFDI